MYLFSRNYRQFDKACDVPLHRNADNDTFQRCSWKAVTRRRSSFLSMSQRSRETFCVCVRWRTSNYKTGLRAYSIGAIIFGNGTFTWDVWDGRRGAEKHRHSSLFRSFICEVFAFFAMPPPNDLTIHFMSHPITSTSSKNRSTRNRCTFGRSGGTCVKHPTHNCQSASDQSTMIECDANALLIALLLLLLSVLAAVFLAIRNVAMQPNNVHQH